MQATRGIGCDAVLIAAATESSAPFETAALVARDRAIVSLVGNTGTAFPYREFMHKELTVVASRSYGRVATTPTTSSAAWPIHPASCAGPRRRTSRPPCT